MSGTRCAIWRQINAPSAVSVRVLTSGDGTAAKVRVLNESSDGRDVWGTVGVSENVIEASWIALADSLHYKLLKDELEAAGEGQTATG